MKNYELAVQIYSKSGTAGIFDAIQDGRLVCDAMLQCEPCEDLQPHEDGTCLVCGTQHQTAKPTHWVAGHDQFIQRLIGSMG